MPDNWWMFFVTGLIPMVVGFLWYGNAGFGKKWMSVNGFEEEDLEGGNMALIFGLSYLFSSFIAFALSGIVVHQSSLIQMMMPDVIEVGSVAQQQYNDMMAQYGDNFRDFKHGALHGSFFAFVFVFPIIAIKSLFERRGWSYIWIHAGYWIVCLGLMGGILSQTLVYGSL